MVAHAQDEITDRPYLLLDGTDAKVHLLYQNEDIQTARHGRSMKLNSFVRLEKRFANGRPFLQVEDLGDADKILKDTGHFESAVSRHSGSTAAGQVWDGWLGRYHIALGQQLAKKKERALGAQEQDLSR